MTALSRVARISLATLVLALSSTLAFAQTEGPMQDIDVTAFRTVLPLSSGAAWRHVDLIHLSRAVSYADLDLATESGAEELRQRVEDTAHALCEQIQREHPFADETFLPSGSCVEEALKGAMAEADAVIAAAEKAKTDSPEMNPK